MVPELSFDSVVVLKDVRLSNASTVHYEVSQL